MLTSIYDVICALSKCGLQHHACMQCVQHLWCEHEPCTTLQLMDWFPTICDQGGVPHPGQHMYRVDSTCAAYQITTIKCTHVLHNRSMLAADAIQMKMALMVYCVTHVLHATSLTPCEKTQH